MRLFLAGKWRKVTVSDVVPVGLDGKPLLASSVQQLELWPTILAKAVYTVYHACGYSSSLGTLQADGIATGRFLGFVLHLLHGWTPSLPIDLRSAYPPAAGMMVGDGTVLTTLLDDMVSGGTPLVPVSEIPEENPTKAILEKMASNRSVRINNCSFVPSVEFPERHSCY